MTRFIYWLAAGLSGLLLLGAGPIAAQTHYVPTEESRVWIEGTSSVHDFTCSTERIDGRVRLDARADSTARARPKPRRRRTGMEVPSTALVGLPEGAPRAEAPTLQATVPVHTLDCGKQRQNRDLYEAMKADEHPVIRYELLDVEVVSEPEGAEDPYVLHATGRLTIAGVTRTVTLGVRGHRLDDGLLHARGSTPLQMTDFEIDPPTALLGLIRVRDDLVVHFDITAGRHAPAEVE